MNSFIICTLAAYIIIIIIIINIDEILRWARHLAGMGTDKSAQRYDRKT
jgi:hypothetical protein